MSRKEKVRLDRYTIVSISLTVSTSPILTAAPGLMIVTGAA